MKSRYLLPFLFYSLVSCSLVSPRDPASVDKKQCFQIMKELLKWQRSYEGHVELLWWPKAATKVITHTDIVVDNEIYSPFLGLTKVGELEKKLRRAKEGKGKAFFRFTLNLSPEEYSRLRNIVDDPSSLETRRIQTCVGGACKMLRNNTSLKVPFPFSQVPSLNALYFYTLNKMGHKKIVSVEYVGPGLWRTLLSYEPFVEVAGVVGTVGLIVWSVNSEDEIEATIIPISEAAKVQ